ncbi:MAG TPA: hypothetical protein VGU20_11180 [Stellaceae bacterium]|nr:hypothetical protein [Stellaceae bacterium]
MNQDTTYVAFDTSNETLAVAIAENGRRKEVRFFGTIASRPDAVRKLVEKLAKQHKRLAFCYEAGPTGYGHYRQIRAMGHDCQVVAPSMVPVRPGRAHQDRPPRRHDFGRAVPCRRADGDLGSGRCP